VQALCKYAQRLEFKKGMTLLRRGEFSRTFYIVEEGKCELRADSDTASAAESLASVMLQRMQRKEQFLVYLDATPREVEEATESNFDFSLATIKEKSARNLELRLSGKDFPSSPDTSPSPNGNNTSPKRPLSTRRRPLVSLDNDGLQKRESDPGLRPTPRWNATPRMRVPPSPSQGLLTDVLGQRALKRCLSRHQSNGLPTLNRLSSSEDDEEEEDYWSPMTPSSYDDQAIDQITRDTGGGTAMLRHAERNDGVLGVRVAGDSFGELALLYNAPQASTVIACEDTVVWAISQRAFRRATHETAKTKSDRHDEVLSCLEGVDLLHGLWAGEKRELVRSLQFHEFQADDWVVREGEDVRRWFIVVNGEFTCYRHEKGQMQELVRLGTHMHFGERSLLLNKPSEFAVKVTSARARCLVMDREAFSHLAGFLRGEPLLNSAKDASLQTFMAEKQAVPIHQVSPSGRHCNRPTTIDISKLTRIGVLGSGAFGLVTLEKDQRSGKKIAVKALSKGHIVTTCSQEHVKRERELLLLMDSPFIVRLHMTSQDDDNLYFYFDPALGGDLRTLHHRNPDLFKERSKVTTFTVLCLVAALGHVHERAIIFRDLKPENVLLNLAGIAQLCDFGFARLLLGKARTLVGTPEYLAPEVVKHEGYDRMVDWWALGVLTYELLVDEPPFGEADEDPDGVHGVFRKIIKGIENRWYWPFSNQEARDFVKECLKSNPRARLGKEGGHRQVADMPYFKKSFDYEKFCRREVKPPYIPQVDNDLSAFDEDIDLPPVAPYIPDSSGWDADF